MLLFMMLVTRIKSLDLFSNYDLRDLSFLNILLSWQTMMIKSHTQRNINIIIHKFSAKLEKFIKQNISSGVLFLSVIVLRYSLFLFDAQSEKFLNSSISKGIESLKQLMISICSRKIWKNSGYSYAWYLQNQNSSMKQMRGPNGLKRDFKLEAIRALPNIQLVVEFHIFLKISEAPKGSKVWVWVAITFV